MSLPRRRKIVVLGMMTKHPVAGVVWQTAHYLVGLERLGYEAYYVEAGGLHPSSMIAGRGDDDRSEAAAAFLDRVMRRFGLDGRWAFHALHSDGRCYGMSETRLRELYRSAELIVNLHGATIPLPEHYQTGRLVYLETDPVAVQIELHQRRQETIDYLAPHCAFFSFGESYGRPGCKLPVSERFAFRPTRQPVVMDFWEPFGNGAGPYFTTVGNWEQRWRGVRFEGEVYHWSKHLEFLKFLDLPARVGQAFELALSRYDESVQRMLEEKGWRVRNALDFSLDLDDYRGYVAGSRAEFTVAKDQNIRLRTGWFSDRSATYLAAGRPVVTQQTGFSDHLPTGEGLFAFFTLEEAAAAVEAIDRDHTRHSRAARAIAREYFSHEVVLSSLLAEVGCHPSSPNIPVPKEVPVPAVNPQPETPPKRRSPASERPARSPRPRVGRSASVLALIPHHRCQEWLGDCLESLESQTRPLDGIVVIDDASDEPPVDIVREFPQVTLLKARVPVNVGPYRLHQQVIDTTEYDAYLFQDADDWSSADRLERLLAGAERSGAELIGSQEVRVLCGEGEVVPFDYPLDVNAALAEQPTSFPLLHPTSLVSRRLVLRIGGYATGLRFGGDAEFLRRAVHAARVVNVPDYCYYRRIRSDSLTSSATTGFQSTRRRDLIVALHARAQANAALVARGEEPYLAPVALADPIPLEHICGPPLRPARRPVRRPKRARAVSDPLPPVIRSFP